MLYNEFLEELNSFAEPSNAQFMQGLMGNNSVTLLGVRTPTMRKLAKKYMGEWESIFAFPNDYYEVRFIKLTQISLLPWEKFISNYKQALPLICNWALCDSFIPKCMQTHQKEFVGEIQAMMATDSEFIQRYALITLLHFYVEREYNNLILQCLQQANTHYFYVHMGAAWLVAEVLCKDFEWGLTFLKQPFLDKKTHNKAILKATESFRLTKEKKDFLKTLKV
jgi:3-methyladenine DNA glycosylase AlkD